MGNASGWTEGILFALLFIGVLGIVVASFNVMYGKNYSVGLNNSGDEQPFIEYQETASQQIEGGEVEFDAEQGITLKSSYGIFTDVIKILWTFLTGGFIENVVSYLNLGEAGTALALTLRVLYFLSLVFALLYILFKVVI